MSRFHLDDVQAQAICDMRLIALQGLNREKLENEYKELEERIAYFNKLLSDEEMLKGVLKEELTAIRDKYGKGAIGRASTPKGMDRERHAPPPGGAYHPK